MCKHHSTVLSECEVTSVGQVTDKHVYAITTTNQRTTVLIVSNTQYTVGIMLVHVCLKSS